jgi:hypothetical protein
MIRISEIILPGDSHAPAFRTGEFEDFGVWRGSVRIAGLTHSRHVVPNRRSSATTGSGKFSLA